ncbi:MAG: hypothetical protein JNJ39_07235 [Blastocatellia bacterium]|nr:hypothetical protein [Blastocatellia bacterium]
MIDLCEFGFDDRETGYIKSYIDYCRTWKPPSDCDYRLYESGLDENERLSRLLSYLNHQHYKQFYREVFFDGFEVISGDEEPSAVDSYGPEDQPFDPLELFDLLGEGLEKTISLKNDPLLAVSEISECARIFKLGGAPGYRYFLGTLEGLIWVHSDRVRDDKEFQNCARYVSALWEASIPALNWERIQRKRSVWECPSYSVTEIYLESLPDNDSRIEHLRKLKIECEAYHSEAELEKYTSEDAEYKKGVREAFIKLCDINIRRLEALQELKLPDEASQPTIDQANTKNGDRTLDRTTLFLNYLLTNAKVDCTNIDKAKTISFLTGYSEKTIRQKLSNIHGKDNEKSFETYNEDMRKVRDYFSLVGLTEIAESVERDLSN